MNESGPVLSTVMHVTSPSLPLLTTLPVIGVRYIRFMAPVSARTQPDTMKFTDALLTLTAPTKLPMKFATLCTVYSVVDCIALTEYVYATAVLIALSRIVTDGSPKYVLMYISWSVNGTYAAPTKLTPWKFIAAHVMRSVPNRQFAAELVTTPVWRSVRRPPMTAFVVSEITSTEVTLSHANVYLVTKAPPVACTTEHCADRELFWLPHAHTLPFTAVVPATVAVASSVVTHSVVGGGTTVGCAEGRDEGCPVGCLDGCLEG